MIAIGLMPKCAAITGGTELFDVRVFFAQEPEWLHARFLAVNKLSPVFLIWGKVVPS